MGRAFAVLLVLLVASPVRGAAESEGATVYHNVVLKSHAGDRLRCMVYALDGEDLHCAAHIAPQTRLKVPKRHIASLRFNREVSADLSSAQVLTLACSSRINGRLVALADDGVVIEPAEDKTHTLRVPFAALHAIRCRPPKGGTDAKDDKTPGRERTCKVVPPLRGPPYVLTAQGDALAGGLQVTDQGRLRVKGGGYVAELDAEGILELQQAPDSADASRPPYTVTLSSGSVLNCSDVWLHERTAKLVLRGACELDIPVDWLVRVQRRPPATVSLPAGHRLLACGYANRVVIVDDRGQETWSCDAPGALSAELTSDNHVLIACYDAAEVREVARDGTVTWRYPEVRAMHARPLANGNVLIAGYEPAIVLEVDRAGRRVWKCTPPGPCADAVRLDNGHTLIASGGVLREVSAQGRTVWEFAGGDDLYSVQVLPNDNVLVADFGRSQVYEITRDKKTLRPLEVRRPCDAIRLPNGHLLVTTKSRFAEYTPEGEVVWHHEGAELGSARQ